MTDEAALSTNAYWLDGMPQARSDAMPLEVDVAVVGAGYTGLNAALVMAKAGLSVAVLDALEPGGGCSSRNGGQVSPEMEHVPGMLAKLFGKDIAEQIKGEGLASVEWLEDFVLSHGIDCDFARCGLFYAAHTPRAFEFMEAHAQEVGGRVVPRHEQRQELGTDAYFGGLVLPNNGSIHPAKYLHGLLGLVQEAGAAVVGGCKVLEIRNENKGFRLITGKGALRAKEVVIATNGYTTPLVPWVARRVMPVGSYMIATEELDPGLIKALFPTNRVVTDSRHVIYYFRASPDGKRVIFGGRVSAGETDTRLSAPKLRARMVQLFPELSKASITHSWMGKVAFTFDQVPRMGCHEGVHFALGYNGSGIAMSSYLGMKMGQRVLGKGGSVFEDLPDPTLPFYRGTPWFLPAAVAVAQLKDRYDLWRGKS